MTKEKEFSVGEYVVYPPHGVGSITEKVTQTVGGIEIEVFVIFFAREKMTLSVPVKRAVPAGLRHLSSPAKVKKTLAILKEKAKVNKKMWNRKSQEYDAKFNSGDITKIAEIVRDLYPNVGVSERSYSERMVYENAFNLLTEEISKIKNISNKEASDLLIAELKAEETV